MKVVTLLKGNSAVYVGFEPNDLGVVVRAFSNYHPEYRPGLVFAPDKVGPPEYWESKENHVFFDKAANQDYKIEVSP